MTRRRMTRVVMTPSSPTGTATPPTTVGCSPGGRRGCSPSCRSGRSSRSVVKETGSDDDDDSDDDRNDVDDDDRAHFDLSLAKEVGLVSVGGGRTDFLVFHLSELVRMCFMGVTSDSDPLRLERLLTMQVPLPLFFMSLSLF